MKSHEIVTTCFYYVLLTFVSSSGFIISPIIAEKVYPKVYPEISSNQGESMKTEQTKIRRTFTDTYVRSLKPEDKRYELSEPSGLRIRVSTAGSKSWVYVYRIGQRLRRMTIGSYPGTSLSEARIKASEAKISREKGHDPAAESKLHRRRMIDVTTVNELSEEYIKRYAEPRKKTWKEDRRILNKNVLPILGNLPVKDVRRSDMVSLLEDIAIRAPIMSNHTLAVTRKMFNWAIEREIVEINPCWQVSRKGKTKRRDRVLSKKEIKIIWQTLSLDSDDIQDKHSKLWPGKQVRLALKLILLTAQRRAEIAQASIAEIDIETGWWVIPSERAKNGYSHRVPLSDLATEIASELIELAGTSKWLIPSPRGDQPINPEAITRAVTRIRDKLDLEHWSAHDFRRTAATHMASFGIPRLVIGHILNHVDNSVTAIYERHGYDDEKKSALNLWSKELMDILS